MQAVTLPDGPSPTTLGPLLPSFAACVVAGAALWGDKRDGDRPRRFFVGP
jgi:hypothetical protein